MNSRAQATPGGAPRGVAARLHSAAVHLLRTARAADEASGLSPARLSALSVVVFGGPLPLGSLAAAEQVSAPTMSALVRGLEESGLVSRRPDPGDGRGVLVLATARGRRLMERARRRREEVLAGILAGLPRPERAVLGRAADLVEEALRRARARGTPPPRRRPGGSRRR